MGKPAHLGLALSRQLLLVKHCLRLLDYEWDHYPHLSLHTQSHTHIHTKLGSSWTKLVHAKCVCIPPGKIQSCALGLPQQSSPALPLRLAWLQFLYNISSISWLNQKFTQDKPTSVQHFRSGLNPLLFHLSTWSLQIKGNSPRAQWRLNHRWNSAGIVTRSKHSAI